MFQIRQENTLQDSQERFLILLPYLLQKNSKIAIAPRPANERLEDVIKFRENGPNYYLKYLISAYFERRVSSSWFQNKLEQVGTRFVLHNFSRHV